MEAVSAFAWYQLESVHLEGPEAAVVGGHPVPGESYGREDSAYREYLVKLRHLPEGMLTASGRRVARERDLFMQEFFQELDKETGQGASV